MSVRTMNAKRGVILGLFLGGVVSGCAAVVGADGYQVDKSGSGGSGTSGGSGGATGGSAGKGGTGGATGGSGGATGGTGGTGGTPPPPTGFGETICSGATCPTGQSCLNTAYSPPGLCTVPCVDASTCGTGHDCVGSMDASDMFPFSCVKLCSSSSPCPANLLCVQLGSGGSVCLPTGWLDELGIGDDCVVDAQCLSGQCRNKPNGWCSKPCGAADSLCAHDAVDFPNRNNELNWCVTNGGAQTCVPGCDINGTTTCSFYPGTTCRAVTDITGSMQKACLP